MQYQIRFLGYKGVVAVDLELDRDPNGIRMKLRPSMRKFEDSRLAEADIEIARAFDRPNTSYLNRSEFSFVLYHRMLTSYIKAIGDDFGGQASQKGQSPRIAG